MPYGKGYSDVNKKLMVKKMQVDTKVTMKKIDMVKAVDQGKKADKSKY